MSRFVIDAPTLLHIVSEPVTVDAAHQLVAPSIIRSQALALLLESVRRGDLSDRAALDLHDAFTGLKIRLLGDRVSRRTAWRIAREQDWETPYDAEYLAVTRLQADFLITIDPGLAARATGIVPLAPVTALAVP